MSFSMSNIKVKTKAKFNPKEYYSYIFNNPLLTKNVSYALKKYMDFRLTKRQCGLSMPKQKDMIDDLLCFCCNKPYIDITYLDVYDNENEIIYQIKRAIYYGSTKKLYKDDSDVYDFQVRDFVKPPSKPSKRLTTETEIKDYFGDIVI